ncbi:MAG TPA: hypothetical protein VNV82_18480 [Bryobacteraceae bacterium]|nr:hypothetical protein [Bryobacteraceae bacterium]
MHPIDRPVGMSSALPDKEQSVRHPQQTSEQQPPHWTECLLWMAPTLQEKFDVLALVGSGLLSGLLMQSTSVDGSNIAREI